MSFLSIYIPTSYDHNANILWSLGRIIPRSQESVLAFVGIMVLVIVLPSCCTVESDLAVGGWSGAGFLPPPYLLCGGLPSSRRHPSHLPPSIQACHLEVHNRLALLFMGVVVWMNSQVYQQLVRFNRRTDGYVVSHYCPTIYGIACCP